MTWRLYLLSIACGLVVDAVIAWIFVTFFAYEPNSPGNFFFAWGVLIVGSAVFSALSLVKQWAFFLIYGKERAIRLYLKAFHKAKLPSPEGEFDIDAYLTNIIDSAEAAEKTKIAAAGIAGELIGYRAVKPMSAGWMTTIASEHAIQRYIPVQVSGNIDLEEGFFKGT